MVQVVKLEHRLTQVCALLMFIIIQIEDISDNRLFKSPRLDLLQCISFSPLFERFGAETYRLERYRLDLTSFL